MSNFPSPLVISGFIVSLVIGIAIGYSFTSNYRETMYDKNTMDLGNPGIYLDLNYLNTMISHHLGAMALAGQASVQSRDPKIISLSQDIITGEPKAIDELYQFKQNWYRDSRKVASPKTVNLGNYDSSFDLRFLNALITHHQIGLTMTDEIMLKSTRSEVIENAQAVSNFLSGSLVTLKEWRTQILGSK